MRRYNQIIMLTALVALIMGVSACTQDGASGTVFEGGSNGLLFSFMEDAPPDLIYDNGATPFSIIVQAQNDGEFDVDDVHLRVTGINGNDFSNLQTEVAYHEMIVGMTKLESDVIEGQEAFIPVAEDVAYTRSLRGGGELDFTLRVNACYPYATLATSTVCIQNNYLDGDDEVCDPDSSGEVSVSSAPIQVTAFEQQAVGRNTLRVKYTFSLKDNVEIHAPKVGQVCNPATRGERIEQEGWIYVALDDNGLAASVNCVGLIDKAGFDGRHVQEIEQQYLGSPTGNSIIVREIEPSSGDTAGYLNLGSDNEATLTCTLNLRSGITDSLGTVDVLSTYYVEDSISKTITLTHTEAGGGSGTASAQSYNECMQSCQQQGGSGADCSHCDASSSGGSGLCGDLEDEMRDACGSNPGSGACQNAQADYFEACGGN